MQSKYDVLCIGNAIVDVIAQVDEAFVAREKLVKGSMNLIDESRAEQLSAAMPNAQTASGGSAGNTAAGLASLGAKAAYFGKLRDDALGAAFANDMQAIGVHFNTPKAKSGPATARSFIMVTPDGERTMNTYLGACVHFEKGDIARDVIEAASVTYLEGYLFDRAEAKAAFREASAIARAAGRTVALTLSDSFCVDRHRADFLDLIKNSVDIVFANNAEITALYETSDFDTAASKIARDCKLAVLTRSEKGSVILRGTERVAVPAQPVAKVIDATGAGDLFAAGFLFGHTQGKSLQQSAALGALAASEVISHVGARPATNLAHLAKAQGLL